MRKCLHRVREFSADSYLLRYVLSFFVLHTMSAEERRELTRVFNEIDTDKNG